MKPFAKTASAAALASLATASPVLADRPGFTSPSGNIVCYLETGYDPVTPMDQSPFVCLVFSADWSPTVDFGDDDPTCDLDQTRIVILPPDGAATERWVCHGDVFFPIHGAISYGAQWSFFGFTCDVATTGVSCENGQGNGFNVRRVSRTLY